MNKKQALFIAFLLLTFEVAFCQTTRSVTPGFTPRANQFIIPEDGNISARNMLFMPRYTDTTQANTFIFKDTLGAVIYTYDTHGLWVRGYASGKRWIAVGSGGSGTVTASEGLTAVGSDVQFGGPVGTPTTFTEQRVVNVNRQLLAMTNGIPVAAGGIELIVGEPSYSPYQFISQDTITTTGETSPTQSLPLAGVQGHRTLYFNAGAYRTQEVFGHKFDLDFSFEDSMTAHTADGDYNIPLVGQTRIRPRNSGYSAFRVGHGTGANLRLAEGLPAIIGNVFLDPKDDAVTDTLHINGALVGVSSYLVAAPSVGKVNIDKWVYYNTGQFISANTRIAKSYVLAPQKHGNTVVVDSAFFLFDTVRVAKSFIAGNTLIGNGDSTVTQAKLRVNGSFLVNGFAGYRSNVAADYTARSFTDKNYVDSSITASGAGTVTSVGFTGGLISVANPTTTPAFTVAGTSGGIPYFSSTSTWASSGLLAANALVIGGGGGAAPSTSTTGTGVLTALGVNVGSAGAFVTFNGALGTPSSGTLTNATGLPITAGTTGTLGFARGGTGLTALGTDGQQLRVNVGATALEYFTPSAGSSLFPTTGTGTATGNVIGDLDGFSFDIESGGESYLSIAPGDFATNIRADDGTAFSRLRLIGDLVGNDVSFNLSANDDTNEVTIDGDAQAETITYTAANGNTFTGSIFTATDNTYDIGSSSAAFQDIYGRVLHLDGSTSGGVSFQSDALGNAPNATTLSGTGYVPATMISRQTSNFTMSDVNTVQPVFATAQDVWTLQAATTYYFEGFYSFNHGAASHSVGMSFELAGGASVTSIAYQTICWVTAIGTNTASQTTNYIAVATNTAVNAAGANATEQIKFQGFISMNAGGTVQPSVTFSAAPGGAPVAVTGTYITFTPVGINTIATLGNVN